MVLFVSSGENLSILNLDKEKVKFIAGLNYICYIIDPNDGGEYVMPDVQAIDNDGNPMTNEEYLKKYIITKDEVKFKDESGKAQLYPYMFVISEKIFDKIYSDGKLRINMEYLRNVGFYYSNSHIVEDAAKQVDKEKREWFFDKLKNNIKIFFAKLWHAGIMNRKIKILYSPKRDGVVIRNFLGVDTVEIEKQDAVEATLQGWDEFFDEVMRIEKEAKKVHKKLFKGKDFVEDDVLLKHLDEIR